MARLRRRPCRLSTALLMVLSLLFSQLALAFYVCPKQADMAAMAEMMAAGTPCEGMDTQQPLLCHQHTADPGQTFEAAKAPAASLPAVVQVLEWPRLPDAHAAAAWPDVGSGVAWPPPDPLFLATRRLRV